MNLVSLYECLCDVTRLRILNLLRGGPLCVCHLQEVLGEPQVKISKHLSYLKERGVVSATREGNWMIYALPKKSERPAALRAAIASFSESADEAATFKRDLAKLAKIDLSCSPLPAKSKKKSGAVCAC
jgi:ArsR family transcriptional regulator